MTAKNPANEKQHYVPEVVLTLFAEAAGKERLCVFDKHSGRAFPGPTAVQKLCKESGFYTADAAHGSVSIESAFHELENEYRKIAGKVIAARSLAVLSAQERGTLVGFVCVQYLRVPRLRIGFAQMTKVIADKVRALAPEAPNLGEFELGDNEIRLQHLEFIARGAVEGTNILSEYVWFLIEPEAGRGLWISDCPVVMHNDEKSIYAGLGFASPGVQIYFPLTPKLLLACWHPVVAGQFLQQRDSARKHLGQMKGQYTLGLNGNKAALAVEIDAMEETLKPIEHIINAFETGGSAMASADNVRHFNALQFQWSHRFILCTEGAFDEAAHLLKEHPHLKTGIAMGGD
ncbi:DUF4238 domain-containing protein [Hyphomicrobium zavarzinii]|uniref:DUF4238 domain-containing protein n=1 Tax=Hyphomicrobium zavarzinii TaxID=48292 RepID=UPI00035F8971|nr:DUF4238 domain-containing protein [Hyphomicrobium zavarzinii]